MAYFYFLFAPLFRLACRSASPAQVLAIKTCFSSASRLNIQQSTLAVAHSKHRLPYAFIFIYKSREVDIIYISLSPMLPANQPTNVLFTKRLFFSICICATFIIGHQKRVLSCLEQLQERHNSKKERKPHVFLKVKVGSVRKSKLMSIRCGWFDLRANQKREKKSLRIIN